MYTDHIKDKLNKAKCLQLNVSFQCLNKTKYLQLNVFFFKFQTSDQLIKNIPLVGERISFDVNDLATVKISFLIIKLIIYSSQ